MPTKKYSVQLKGKGVLDEYAVRLEGTNVPMDDKGGYVYKNRKPAARLVNNTLHVQLSCKALTHTKWSFEVRDIEADKVVYSADGEIGDSHPGKLISKRDEIVNI